MLTNNYYSLQYPPDVLPVLTNVECNDYNPDELSTSGSLHILRCPNNIIDNDDKTCASSISIVAVQCGESHNLQSIIFARIVYDI